MEEKGGRWLKRERNGVKWGTKVLEPGEGGQKLCFLALMNHVWTIKVV